MLQMPNSAASAGSASVSTLTSRTPGLQPSGGLVAAAAAGCAVEFVRRHPVDGCAVRADDMDEFGRGGGFKVDE
jgi:hypothetical protein